MLEKNPQLDLSRAFLYYEERALEGTTGQDAGASIKDICAATQKRGICPTPDMPYVPGEYKAAPSQTALDTAVRFKIGGSKIVLGVDGVKTALYTRSQPVIIGMTVYASMESDAVAKSGILPMPKLGEQIVGGHAVLIVGWHDNPKLKDNPDDFIDEIIREIEDLTSAASKGYFIVRNSWGADWGQKGYFMMPYEYFERYAYDFWIMEA
jgi:C1A family cysteine protease